MCLYNIDLKNKFKLNIFKGMYVIYIIYLYKFYLHDIKVKSIIEIY